MSHESCDMRHWTRTKGNGSESISSARNWARTFRVSPAIVLGWEASLWGHRDQLKHRDTYGRVKVLVSRFSWSFSFIVQPVYWTLDRWTYGLVGYLVFLSKRTLFFKSNGPNCCWKTIFKIQFSKHKHTNAFKQCLCHGLCEISRMNLTDQASERIKALICLKTALIRRL